MILRTLITCLYAALVFANCVAPAGVAAQVPYTVIQVRRGTESQIRAATGVHDGEPAFAYDTLHWFVGYGGTFRLIIGASGAPGQAGTIGLPGAAGANGATGAQGVPGPAGSAGATGPTGPAGANGTNGTNGTNGANGTVIYNQAGLPSTGTGINGDYDLNTATGDLYQKSAGAWGIIENLKGPTGANGAAGVGFALGTASQTAHMNAGGTAFVTDSGLLNDGTNTTIAGSLTAHGATVYGTLLANNLATTGDYLINSSSPIIRNAYPVLLFDPLSVFTTSRFMDTVQAAGYKSSDGSAGVTGTGGGGDAVKNGLVTSLGTAREPALGSPASDGQVLASTAAGVRSWVSPASGPAGPAGATGPTGATGAAGTNGTNGSNGAAGATGPAGPNYPIKSGASVLTSSPASLSFGAGLLASVDGSNNVSVTGNAGTVTSVGLTMPGTIFNSTVPGSPVTASGALAPTLATQAPNFGLFGPASGGTAAAPTFRALVPLDIPASLAGTGLASTAGVLSVTAPVPASAAINTVLAGPASGAAGAVTARALVTADLPSQLPASVGVGAAATADALTVAPAASVTGVAVVMPSGATGMVLKGDGPTAARNNSSAPNFFLMANGTANFGGVGLVGGGGSNVAGSVAAVPAGTVISRTYMMGSDMGLFPVPGSNDVIQAYNGITLDGNTQTVPESYTPSAPAGVGGYHVGVRGRMANIPLLVLYATSGQTAALLDTTNSTGSTHYFQVMPTGQGDTVLVNPQATSDNGLTVTMPSGATGYGFRALNNTGVLQMGVQANGTLYNDQSASGHNLILSSLGSATYGGFTANLEVGFGSGFNGFKASTVGIGLVDFLFNGSGTTRAFRMEARGGQEATGSPEFQIGGTSVSSSTSTLCVGDTGVVFNEPVVPRLTSQTGLTIKAASGQTANLEQDTTSTGTILFARSATGHLISGGTAPTAAIGTAAASVTVSTTATDSKGLLTVTTAASPTAGQTLVVCTFANAYAAAPVVVISPSSAGAVSAGCYVSAVSTTGFTVTNANAGPVSAAETISYMVTQ